MNATAYFGHVCNWQEAKELGKRVHNDIFDRLPKGAELFVVIVDESSDDGLVKNETAHVFDSFMTANAIMNNHEYGKEAVEVYCVTEKESCAMFYKVYDGTGYHRLACCGRQNESLAGIRRLFDNNGTVKIYF